MEKEGVEPVLAHGASVAPVPTDFPVYCKPHQGIEP